MNHKISTEKQTQARKQAQVDFQEVFLVKKEYLKNFADMTSKEIVEAIKKMPSFRTKLS